MANRTIWGQPSEKRFALRSTDSSSLGDIGQGEQTRHDVGESHNKTPNARAAQKVDLRSTADSAFSGVLPGSTAKDALDGCFISPRQEPLEQVAKVDLLG